MSEDLTHPPSLSLKKQILARSAGLQGVFGQDLEFFLKKHMFTAPFAHFNLSFCQYLHVSWFNPYSFGC